MKKAAGLVLAMVILITFSTTVFAVESVPLILYEEREQYANQTVKVDCVFGFNHGSSRDVWYKTKTGYQYERELSRDLAIGMNKYISSEKKQYLRNPEEGVVHRVTMVLYDDGSMGASTITEYELLSETVNIDDLIQEYKDSCQDIAVKTILRNPKVYEGQFTYVEFEGEVLQIIEDYYGPAGCILITNDYEDIVYLEYRPDDNDVLMLESDRIKVYGYLPPLKITETYDTLFGKKTVPYVSVEFWDLIEE